jgi:hypothetical protein
MVTDQKVSEQDFSLLAWSATIPMADDVYLGMQARNIAIIDLAVLRKLETQALDEFFSEDERISADTSMTLSALSQMWIFALYEFLRTWRQRARTLLGFVEKLSALASEEERTAYVKGITEDVKTKARLVKLAPIFFQEHVSKIREVQFITEIRNYKAKTDDLFREIEAIRMPLAKHEIAGREKLFAEAPGYGGINKLTGSMNWQVVLDENTVTIIDRRELANKFLGILSVYEEEEEQPESHLENDGELGEIIDITGELGPIVPVSKKRGRRRGRRGGRRNRIKKGW